ncbi:MAG: cell division protein FtsW [Candidatus Andersenbacteria bacterium RIFCSPHIGHO2_12_FULL_45_11b]|uniref:Probable peptidoglycan glycosyltransferase FtsW n=1 Tax=Candidatus Andersenbacteria bacterium RIFCSPHIGHO2_12_FULL_45_11b TaxID=1797282 RepID=A0A1G1X9P8_9BACT|nr:MAG: cell division protein FtsW [Candidatus Andersenbacteria bacterium RIFCSPHIGHO2_12_FULL_45_11b]
MAHAKGRADGILLVAIFGLVVFGLIMVGSASSVLAEQFRDDPFYFLKHQLLYGFLFGVVAFLIGFYTPYTKLRTVAVPAILMALVLLVLVFVPGLKVVSGGSARWIGVGPITVQPSEIAKLGFILYLAALLERKGSDIKDFKKSVVPFLVITGVISLLIILQPDIGTLFTITVIGATMVFSAGFRLRHLALIGLGGVAAFSILVSTAQYRLARLFVYLHPELDPQGIGYQINQALLAVGTGGLWGLGFGRSRQKYSYLPEPAGDTIFAIMSEELGFIRILILLLTFAVIVYRGYKIAEAAPDTFGRLLATGITSWILIQAFVNMASVLAITPLTGIPLPFISYGGSALITLLFASGVLLNISKHISK